MFACSRALAASEAGMHRVRLPQPRAGHAFPGVRLSPASAGIHRWADAAPGTGGRLPRLRGAAPTSKRCVYPVWPAIHRLLSASPSAPSSTPRARGCSRVPEHADKTRRCAPRAPETSAAGEVLRDAVHLVRPACAGTRPVEGPCRVSAETLPRPCGDVPESRGRSPPAGSVAPRARGCTSTLTFVLCGQNASPRARGDAPDGGRRRRARCRLPRRIGDAPGFGTRRENPSASPGFLEVRGCRRRPPARTMTELLPAVTLALAVSTGAGATAALAAHRWARRVSAAARRIAAGGDDQPPIGTIPDGGELFDRMEAGAKYLQAHQASFTIRRLAVVWTLLSAFHFVAAAAAWAISAVLP